MGRGPQDPTSLTSGSVIRNWIVSVSDLGRRTIFPQGLPWGPRRPSRRSVVILALCVAAYLRLRRHINPLVRFISLLGRRVVFSRRNLKYVLPSLFLTWLISPTLISKSKAVLPLSRTAYSWAFPLGFKTNGVLYLTNVISGPGCVYRGVLRLARGYLWDRVPQLDQDDEMFGARRRVSTNAGVVLPAGGKRTDTTTLVSVSQPKLGLQRFPSPVSSLSTVTAGKHLDCDLYALAAAIEAYWLLDPQGADPSFPTYVVDKWRLYATQFGRRTLPVALQWLRPPRGRGRSHPRYVGGAFRLIQQSLDSWESRGYDGVPKPRCLCELFELPQIPYFGWQGRRNCYTMAMICFELRDYVLTKINVPIEEMSRDDRYTGLVIGKRYLAHTLDWLNTDDKETVRIWLETGSWCNPSAGERIRMRSPYDALLAGVARISDLLNPGRG